MNDLFGFTPKSFTDDELSERVSELNRRMVWAARSGNYPVAQQLMSQKLLLENEQRERYFTQRVAGVKSGVVIETDPDLAEEQRQRTEEEVARTSPKAKPTRKPFIPTRSSRPSTDDEG
jgi:hypothetical protein